MPRFEDLGFSIESLTRVTFPMFRRGQIAAKAGEMFTPFQNENWVAGYLFEVSERETARAQFQH